MQNERKRNSLVKWEELHIQFTKTFRRKWNVIPDVASVVDSDIVVRLHPHRIVEV